MNHKWVKIDSIGPVIPPLYVVFNYRFDRAYIGKCKTCSIEKMWFLDLITHRYKSIYAPRIADKYWYNGFTEKHITCAEVMMKNLLS